MSSAIELSTLLASKWRPGQKSLSGQGAHTRGSPQCSLQDMPINCPVDMNQSLARHSVSSQYELFLIFGISFVQILSWFCGGFTTRDWLR